jgi:hypothetical protein
MLATIIEPRSKSTLTSAVTDGEDVLRSPVVIDRVYPKRIVDLLRDPIAT